MSDRTTQLIDSIIAQAEELRLEIDSGLVEPGSQIVRNGPELSAALASAEPGVTIRLAPDAVFEGDFVLPANGGGTILGDRFTSVIKGRFRTAPRAHDWTLRGFRVDGTPGVRTLVSLGTSPQTAEEEPQRFTLADFDLVGLDNETNRGIALNCHHATLQRFTVTGIARRASDAQAICGWNGHGGYLIEDALLEATGQSVLFGGGDPTIHDLVPSDITIRRTTMRKQASWRDAGYQVKAVFELKNARNVKVIDGCRIGPTWKEEHEFAVVLKTENQDGRAPWSQVEDVLFSDFMISGAGGALNLRGIDPGPLRDGVRLPGGLPARRFTFQRGRIEDVDASKYGGRGWLILAQAGLADLRILDTYARQSGAILMHDGAPCPRLVMTGCDLARGTYGIGAGANEGSKTLNEDFPDHLFAGNAVQGVRASLYPTGNTYLP